MDALLNRSSNLLRTQLSTLSFIRTSLDTLCTIGVLLILIAWYEDEFVARHLILVLMVFFLTFPGKSPVSTSPYGLFKETLGNWGVLVMLLLFLGYATRTLTVLPKELILIWLLVTPVLLVVAHLVVSFWVPKLLHSRGADRKAIIIGAGELGQKLAKQIELNPFLGITFEGFFDDRGSERLENAAQKPLFGQMKDVARYVKSANTDLIYVTLPMASQPRILQLLEELHDTTASIYFVPDIFLFDLIQARIDNVSGIPVVAACETPFYGVSGLTKRLCDVSLSLLFLLLALPVMILIAIGVKLSSPGPVLFKQRRYGVDGRDIIVYKFRSMTVCEDGAEIKQVTRNDQRVTPLGAFLRKTSLDELPQIINVLQGRMSLVGPRPHAVAHNELYRKLIKGYMIRHKVKPGITGWAQVHGLRGETDTLDKMKARIEYDLDYLRNWSLQLDLRIVIKTFVVLLKYKNVY